MLVAINFYEYADICRVLKPGLFHKVRMKAQSYLTPFIHCNVACQGNLYELATWGGSVIPEDDYYCQPSVTVYLHTTKEDFLSFYAKYKKAAKRRLPWLYYVLALFCRSLDNCATVNAPIVGYRANTPSRLYKCLLEETNAQRLKDSG